MYPGYVTAGRVSGESWRMAELIFWVLLIAGIIVLIVCKVRSRRNMGEIERIMKQRDSGDEGPRNPWADE